MAFTLVQIETVLVSRTEKALVEADFATTVDGSNADLMDPIRFAISQVGLAFPTDPTSLADADISGLTEADFDEFLDYAEYRLLQNIIKNLPEVDVRIGHRQEEFSQ